MPADVRTWWIACPFFWFPSPHHLMQNSARSKLKLLLVLPILPHLKIAQIIAQISSFFPELQVLHSPPSVFNVISLSLSLLISLPSRFFSSFCFTVFMSYYFELPKGKLCFFSDFWEWQGFCPYHGQGVFRIPYFSKHN